MVLGFESTAGDPSSHNANTLRSPVTAASTRCTSSATSSGVESWSGSYSGRSRDGRRSRPCSRSASSGTTLRILGKGKKAREVPFHPQPRRDLTLRLEERRTRSGSAPRQHSSVNLNSPSAYTVTRLQVGQVLPRHQYRLLAVRLNGWIRLCGYRQIKAVTDRRRDMGTDPQRSRQVCALTPPTLIEAYRPAIAL
jgi:hypothetical protein